MLSATHDAKGIEISLRDCVFFTGVLVPCNSFGTHFFNVSLEKGGILEERYFYLELKTENHYGVYF